MFKKTIALALLTATLLTGSSLHAVRWTGRDWGNFALGAGLGIVGTSIVNSCNNSCSRETVVVRREPVVVCREPVAYRAPAPVVYCETTYYPRNNYDYIGKSIVACVSSTCNARTLSLDNGMVFEIAAGTINWTGYNVTIYRDVTRSVSNYVLKLGNHEFRANRLESSNPIPAPAPAPIPVPRPR